MYLPVHMYHVPQSLHVYLRTQFVGVNPFVFHVILCSAGWRKDYTKSGRPYYRNTIDQTTCWEKPAGTSAGRSGSSSGGGGRDTNDRPKKMILGAPKASSDSPPPAGTMCRICIV